MQNQRNIILAVILTGLLLFGWDAGIRYLYPNAAKPKPAAAAPVSADPAKTGKPTREGGLTNAADIALEAQDLKTALARATAGKGDPPRKPRGKGPKKAHGR